MGLFITILEGAERKSKAADAKFGYAGDRFGPSILRFDSVGGRVAVKQIGSQLDCPGSVPQRELLEEAYCPLTVKEFEVLKREPGCSLVDVTDWLRDGYLWGLRPFGFSIGIGAEQQGEITDVIGLPDGVIVRSERVYGAVPRLPETSADGQKSRWKLGGCLRLLPRDRMEVRYASPRVGYFSIPHAVVDTSDWGTVTKRIVKRWRLEVAEADRERYERGGLVEPCQKIVLYVDRQFPRKWWQHILKAVDNWNAVFECCGFKNAIEGRMAPDSAAYDDAALSWIVYKVGPMENAYGRPYIDFRSGEILGCHVAVFHSVFDMLCRWYVSQTGKGAETFSEEVAGKLLEMVVTHEVGHVLGLTHNFYGSSLFTTDELRDTALMRKTGHGSSIMDYMRLNYAVDSVGDVGELIPRIGAYDSLAVEWGYRCFPGRSPEAVQVILDNWLDGKQRERRYRFQDASSVFPEAQAEDLGRNSLEVAAIGIRKLLRLGMVPPGACGPGVRAVEESRNKAVRDQYTEYVNQALAYIGGRRRCWEPDTVPLEAVGSGEQRAALSFLRSYVLAGNESFPLEWREEWARKVLDDLVRRVCDVADCERCGIGGYSTEAYVGDLYSLFEGMDKGNAWNRFLLWCYTENVGDFVKRHGAAYPEAASLLCDGLHAMARGVRKQEGAYWESWRNNVNAIIGK